MKKLLITGFVVAYAACAVSANDQLTDGQLDAVTAGGASASATADALGIIAATTTFTFAETRANSSPILVSGPARNQASALLSGNYSPAPSGGTSGGGTGEVSTSQSSSSVNTNVAPTTPIAPASNLTAAQRVLLGVR